MFPKKYLARKWLIKYHYGFKIGRTIMLSLRKFLSFLIHDDVTKWKYFPRYWPFVRGIHRSPVNSPHKGQWRGAFVFSLFCAWINGWVNNRESSDLRRHCAHYDVTVMSSPAQPDNRLLQAGMVLQFQPKLLINALQKEWCYVRKSLTKYDLTGNNAYNSSLVSRQLYACQNCLNAVEIQTGVCWKSRHCEFMITSYSTLLKLDPFGWCQLKWNEYRFLVMVLSLTHLILDKIATLSQTYSPAILNKIVRPLTAPIRASHGVPAKSCELFDQTKCTAVSSRSRCLMWPREQHRRKIPTGASLGLTGEKLYECKKSYGPWLDVTEALQALCEVDSPHEGQWRGALMFSLICARTNGWANNRDAGDLRRYRAHCDVPIMQLMLGVELEGRRRR